MSDKFVPPPRTWRRKFADAFRGLAIACRTETSYRVHLPMAVAVVVAAVVLHVPLSHGCLLILAIAGVLAAETFNTAIERLARATRSDENPDLAAALEMSSAAVLVAALAAVAIGVIVFLPRLIALF